MICPKCNGETRLRIAFPHNPDKPTISCFFCKGTGVVSEEVKGWIEDGKILKDKRIEKKITLRNAALKLGNGDLGMASKLSDMELGINEPDQSIYDEL